MKKLVAAFAIAAAASAPALAQKSVTFAHQDMIVPLRTVMESGELEKATGYKINWRMFGGGGDVIKAMASGDVHIGEAGSSPITAAASQGQDIQLFWILDDIAAAEALIARKGSGINSIKDLKGKKIGVPFVSTAHYQLLAALQHSGVNPKDVNILNLRPPEIAAAWERGDLDAAFIWDPVLTKIKGNGTVLADSTAIGKLGYPTFDGLIVNKKWASENQAFMVALVKVMAKADADYRANKAKWGVDSPQAKAIAKWTKAEVKDVPATLALYTFPTAEEQLGAKWLGGGAQKAMKDTATFLKEQGRIQEVKPNYGDFVTTEYIKKALGK